MAATIDALLAELPRLASGALMLGVATWLFTLDPAWRTGRLFALYMLVRGSLNLILPFSNEGNAAAGFNVYDAYAGYLHILVPFTALAFAIHFGDPTSRRAWTRPLFIGCFVAPLPLLWLYAVDHSWMWAVLGGHGGQLFAVVGLASLSYVLVAWILDTASEHETLGARRGGLRLLAGASLLFPVFAAGLDLNSLWTGRLSLFGRGGLAWTGWLRMAALGVAAAIVARRLRAADGARRPSWTIVAVVAAFLSGFVPILFDGSLYWPVATFLNGIWTMAMPIAAAVALVQYQVFGEEVRLRATFQLLMAVVGAVMVLALVGQVLQGRVDNVLVWVLGIVLFTVAVVPLAWQIGQRLVPAPAGNETYAARMERFRKAHRLAVSQGAVTGMQRRRLERMRVRLGLPEGVLDRLDGPVYLDR